MRSKKMFSPTLQTNVKSNGAETKTKMVLDFLKIIALIFAAGITYNKLISDIEILKKQNEQTIQEIQEMRAAYVRKDVQELRDKRVEEKLEEIRKILEKRL